MDENGRLNAAEQKAQRRRSVGIALFLVVLIVIFYVVTVIKLSAS